MSNPSAVAERLSAVLKTGKHYDVEFVLQNGDKLKAHKLVFAIASPVFDVMLYGHLAEKDEVMIEDIDPEAFKTMSEFIYTNKLNLESIEQAISVYKASDKYNVLHLEKLTEEYIKLNITPSDVLLYFEFVKFHSTILQLFLELIQTKPKSVFDSDQFLDCSIDLLEAVVNLDKLNLSEIELFNYIEKWAKYGAEKNGVTLSSCRPFLHRVVKKIRFLAMDVNEFLTTPFRSELLTFEEKNKILMNYGKRGSEPLPDEFPSCIFPRLSNQLTWKEGKGGSVPSDAIKAGIDADGTILYIGRAWHALSGVVHLVPGKVQTGHGCLYFPFNGKEYSKREYEVLCGENVGWIHSSRGEIHPRAVCAGDTNDGKKLYIGRAMHDRSITPGKIVPEEHALYLGFLHIEHRYESYEVLISLG